MPFSDFVSAFSPNDMIAMRLAYDGVCDDLGIRTDETERREMVAHVIVNIAKTGEFDPARLKSMAKMQLCIF